VSAVGIWEGVKTTMKTAHFAVFVEDTFMATTAKKVRIESQKIKP